MATVVLQTVGATVGGAIGGPIGAVVGRAAGALAGSYIDQQLFSDDETIHGPRLENARIFTSRQGASIPRIFGQCRLGGELIWATRFEEEGVTTSGGGKGGPPGPSTTNYEYFANFAMAVCEGEIAHVRRIWADSRPLDLSVHEVRVYRGTGDQTPDPLIEAKQGADNAPAYRGVAYLVFERLPLSEFGNRIPQISVEIVRPVGELEKSVQAVTIIPGSTEFGYHPMRVKDLSAYGTGALLNRHNARAETDWQASINELQAVCPNLKSVALVVAWFGNDLRCGHCTLRPGIETTLRTETSIPWAVSGIAMDAAHIISQYDQRPAFGSTPSDNSVIAAIADLKARGLKVLLYPFIMMDIAAGNTLPDPYGGAGQAVYPWRGMITGNIALGQAGTTDLTAAARTEIDAFIGTAAPGDFAAGTDTVIYNGSAEWSYRRLILHYARLAALAGGVEGFLIGSEMEALTRLRDDANSHPMVDELVSLVSDVRSIVGPSTKLTYAANWAEYFGFQPPEAPGDLVFHLDDLWASTNIDAVGVDNYMPLGDWRDSGVPNPGFARSAYARAETAASVAGGEGYDWYYASALDRALGIRTDITDSLGEPWVWRFKDLVSWWSNAHHNRVAGIRSATPTSWIAQSKPIWFTELGCPAIDKGANQPNVFFDPKSAQSEIPYFSDGTRDDYSQRRYLEAHLAHWDPTAVDFEETHNPPSSLFSGRMIDPETIFIWTWDARPFPEFPNSDEVWGDAQNWNSGHWLNGRLGAAPLSEFISELLRSGGHSAFDASQVDGVVDGVLMPDPASARRILEPILALFRIEAFESDGIIRFTSRGRAVPVEIELGQEQEPLNKPAIIRQRSHEAELPTELSVKHLALSRDYDPATSLSKRGTVLGHRQATMDLPIVLETGAVGSEADDWLREVWIGRETLEFSLPHKWQNLEPGDLIKLDAAPGRIWRIESIEDSDFRAIVARAYQPIASTPSSVVPQANSQTFREPQAPIVTLLDLPNLTGVETGCMVRFALYSVPWQGPYSLFSSPTDEAYEFQGKVARPAIMGTLVTALSAAPFGRWIYRDQLELDLFSGALASADPVLVLNGANAIAVEADNGDWEIIQFRSAELIAPNRYRLSSLLRAQAGSDQAMNAGASVGNRFVVLNQALGEVAISASLEGLAMNWRVGPSSRPASDPSYTQLSHTSQRPCLTPFSPVHVRGALHSNGDLAISWIRRSRIDADSWEPAEIPLGEAEEAYELRVLVSGVAVRTVESAAPQYTYSASDQSADHGGAPSQIDLQVRQIGTSRRLGYPTLATISLS